MNHRAEHLHKEAGLQQLTVTGPDISINAITADSRQVKPGTLFAALPGSKIDGTRFIPQAIDAGASGILVADSYQEHIPADIAQFRHPDPRLALAHLAGAFYNHPGKKLKLIAITGTNGKTTVAAMLEAILTIANEPVGIIGTTGIRWPNHQQKNPLTTPDPIALQATLAQMVEANCKFAILEVSSHALTQHRVAGLAFASAIFTNLSRDHLDYHGSQKDYFRAKASLFIDNQPPFAVINIDDPHGVELYKLCHKSTKKISFSLTDNSFDLHAVDIKLSGQGTNFLLTTATETVPVNLPTVGRFNVANALAAAGAGLALGISSKTIAKGLNSFHSQPGRMQSIYKGQPFGVIVDFAHTPDALENLILATREISNGRIITLFGCGGDRDRGKRPLMGKISAKLSDLVILTDDNPRSEDPNTILEEILDGCLTVSGGAQVVKKSSRTEAIDYALAQAKSGDTVLIAGKGHETYQITATGTHPYDDHQTAIDGLLKLGYTK
ncbi:MAG: UDP-N-acetylmuramoyl-L-alanyl-D-glutamate--2,6-diaminopimelate ligase [Magnetococcales bacterium]|nr:UDP-N-acetylmuramoyl-L-alanyl-D-glutamate--2,6-diaminopimelate ligase [Magnetococcales bacterium]